MPRAALSEVEVDAQRERISSAAEGLFAERGFGAVTMRAIAARLGCSPMTPYRYFASKDEIFDAVRTAAFARFADRQERAASGPGDVRERLLALGRDYVAFARKEPDAYRIMFELGQDGLSERRELWTESKRAWRPMHTAVADAVAAGPFGGDVETLAHLFWAGVHGIVTLHLAGKLELGRTLEELVEPMLTTLFAGNERGDDNERT